MKTTTEKRIYYAPQMERVLLDNEISLVLMSDDSDPGDPSLSNAPEYFNNDPFKTYRG